MNVPSETGLNVPLETLTSSFQGLFPAVLATCSIDGVPNVTLLSHVEYVDARHVALSFQFFNKSRRNVAENPRALVKVVNPDDRSGWAFDLRYERSETSGPVFERMALRIEAIASYSGLTGIFKLLAADIYEVLSVEPVAEEPAAVDGAASRRPATDPVFTMRALQDLALRVHGAATLEQLLDSILAGLEEHFGFTHSMILLAGEEPGTLITMSTRGYPEGGVGAEARHGEGIAGVVAETRKPIRISGLMRAMLYALAVQQQAQGQGYRPERRIAMPGLANPESQLGVPLLVRGELIGVLCIESEAPYRFYEEDRQTIELLGSYLAVAVQHMQMLERVEATEAAAVVDDPPPAAAVAASRTSTRRRREVTMYRGDECILMDGEYLIRSLPARILWKLLSARCHEGRGEFTNRELRLDKSLNLPDYKDNLETRLLLLRRRLDQKCSDIRIVPSGRGRFVLQLDCDLDLQERA